MKREFLTKALEHTRKREYFRLCICLIINILFFLKALTLIISCQDSCGSFFSPCPESQCTSIDRDFLALATIYYIPAYGFIGYLITKSILVTTSTILGISLSLSLPLGINFLPLFYAIACIIGCVLAWVCNSIYLMLCPQKRVVKSRRLQKQLNHNTKLLTHKEELAILKFLLNHDIISEEQYDSEFSHLKENM